MPLVVYENSNLSTQTKKVFFLLMRTFEYDKAKNLNNDGKHGISYGLPPLHFTRPSL